MVEPQTQSAPPKVMGWPLIIGIIAGTCIVTGMTIGGLGQVFGIDTSGWTGLIGLVPGAVGGVLIGRRREALKKKAG